MTLKKVYQITGSELVIHLPDTFRDKKKVLVVIDDSIDTVDKKLDLLKKAAFDPVFLKDVKEISEDFAAVENESL